MDPRRKAKLAATQAAVEAMCETHVEEDIINALADRCIRLANEMMRDGNTEAAFYWRTLGQRLSACVEG